MANKTSRLGVLMVSVAVLLSLAACHQSRPRGQALGDDDVLLSTHDRSAFNARVESLTARIEELELAQTRRKTGSSRLPVQLAGGFIDVAGRSVLGSPDAALAIVEFTDYQCPYCRAHHGETLPELTQDIIANGQAAYFVFGFPLPGHESSGVAAMAANCAEQWGLFWPYHDLLFKSAVLPDRDAAVDLAVKLGADRSAFSQCLEERLAGTFLDQQRAKAIGLGIKGTPTFLIGRLSEKQVVTDITVLAGRQSLEDFRQVLKLYQLAE